MTYGLAGAARAAWSSFRLSPGASRDCANAARGQGVAPDRCRAKAGWRAWASLLPGSFASAPFPAYPHATDEGALLADLEVLAGDMRAALRQLPGIPPDLRGNLLGAMGPAPDGRARS